MKRTRLTAVYLTATERDVVMSALAVLFDHLQPAIEQHQSLSSTTRFARSFTAKRIGEVRELFRDKATTGSAA